MSASVAPSFWACLTLEFMKTVQREPRSMGLLASRAAWEKSWMDIFKDLAKVSRKEPQPDEQASLSRISSI